MAGNPDMGSYVKGVPDQLLTGSNDYESLGPGVWKRSHSQSIRQHRVAEQAEDERSSKKLKSNPNNGIPIPNTVWRSWALTDL